MKNEIQILHEELGGGRYGSLRRTSKLLGVHRETLGKWISGERRPSAPARRAAQFLLAAKKIGVLEKLVEEADAL